MSVVSHKKVVRNYKERLRKKLDSIIDETNTVTGILQENIGEFQSRIECLLRENEYDFFSQYKILSKDLDNFSEKLFACLNTLTNDAISDEIEEVSSTCSSKTGISESFSCSANYQKDICEEESVVQRTHSSASRSDQETISNLFIDAASKKEVDTKSESKVSLCNDSFIDSGIACSSRDFLYDNLNENQKESIAPEGAKTSSPLSTFASLSKHEDSHFHIEEQNNPFETQNKTDNVNKTLVKEYLPTVRSSYTNDDTDSVNETHVKEYLSTVHSSYANDNTANKSKNFLETENDKNFNILPSKLTTFQNIFLPNNGPTFSVNNDNLLETGNVYRRISNPDVPISSYVTAVITYAQSPSDFWMQLDDHETKKHCSFSLPKKVNRFPLSFQVRGYCLAPYKQSNLCYRAEILAQYSEKMLAKVFFIDYGNIEEVPMSELQPLPESCFSIPAQAIHCYLLGVEPKHKTWSQEAIEKFKEIQEYSDVQTFIALKSGDMYGVTLTATVCLPEEEETISYDIAQMLCLNDLAKYTDSCEVTPERECSKDCNVCDSLTEKESYPAYNEQRIVSSDNSYSHFSDSNAVKQKMDVVQFVAKSSVSPASDSNVKDKLIAEEKNNLDENIEIVCCNTKENGIFQGRVLSAEHTRYNNLVMCCNDIFYLSSDEDFDPVSSSKSSQDKNVKQLMETCDVVSEIVQQSLSEKKFSWNVVIPEFQLDFEKDKLLTVSVTAIVSPSEFYVNVVSENISELDDLHEQLTAFYNTQKNRENIPNNAKNLQKNMFCCCRYKDGNWYRGRILDISKSQENGEGIVLIQYVDYGNKELIKFSDMQPLTEEFARYPAFVICCSLAHIVPCKISNCEKQNPCTEDIGCDMKWPKDSIDHFKSIVNYEKFYTVQLTEMKLIPEKNRVYEVYLWDAHEPDDLLMNLVLVNDGVATALSSLTDQSALIPPSGEPECEDSASQHQDSLQSWDPMAEDFLSPLNSYGVDLDDAEVATLGYKRNDEKYICKFYNLYGRCHRGEKCPYEHRKVQHEGTVDQEYIYALDRQIKISSCSFYTLVQVSCILQPNHLYVVFPYGPKSLDEIETQVGLSSENGELLELAENMRQYYSETCFNENTLVAPAIGQIVAVKSAFDDRWCRGRIVCVQDVAEPVQVFLVDFGQLEWVERRNTREIQPKFLSVPFQAVECFLANVEPNYANGKQCWSKESWTCLTNLVKGKVLLAFIEGMIDSVLYITLLRTSKNEKLVINDYIVKQNFARYKTSI